MILTGAKLEEIGKALYGDGWLGVVALKIRRSKRTIMRWRDSPCGMDTEMRQQLIDMLDEQSAVLGRHRSDLAAIFDDAS